MATETKAVPVVLGKTAAGKGADKALARTALALVDKALPRGFKAARHLELAGNAKTGWMVLPAIEALEHDEASGKLSMTLKLTLAELPKKSIKAMIAKSGALKVASAKKLEPDLKALVAAVAEGAAKDAAKQIR